MIVAPQLMAGARPPTQLVAPSKHLPSWLPLRSYSNSNSINMLSNQITPGLPRLSLSSQTRIVESRSSSFPASHNKLKDNNKYRFLALALANSFYDDESHNTEEGIAASSSLQIEEKVPGKIPSYLNLVIGLGFWAQVICTHIAVTMLFYTRVLTGFMNSPAELRQLEGLHLCTVLSALVAIERYAFVAHEHQKSVNGSSNSSSRFEGMSLMSKFYFGVQWSLPGMCLAIIAMRKSVCSLKIYQEFGHLGLIQRILKSFTPGSLVVSTEWWPLQASTFYFISNLLGLACSLCCYDQREGIQLKEAAIHLGCMALPILGYMATGSLITFFTSDSSLRQQLTQSLCSSVKG